MDVLLSLSVIFIGKKEANFSFSEFKQKGNFSCLTGRSYKGAQNIPHGTPSFQMNQVTDLSPWLSGRNSTVGVCIDQAHQVTHNVLSEWVICIRTTGKLVKISCLWDRLGRIQKPALWNHPLPFQVCPPNRRYRGMRSTQPDQAFSKPFNIPI